MIALTGVMAASLFATAIYWICMQKIRIPGVLRISRKRGRRKFWIVIGLCLALATGLGITSAAEYYGIEPPPPDDATLLYH